MLGNNKPVVLIWNNRHMSVHKHVVIVSEAGTTLHHAYNL